MTILRALTNRRSGSRARHHDRKRRRCFPGIEGLEGRALLSTLTVTTLGDSGPGTLRATVGNALPGDTINFSSTLDGQVITLTSGEISLPPGITIEGPGSNQLLIDANGNSRIFECDQDDGAQAVTSISGLFFGGGAADVGGAIDFTDPKDSLMVSDCHFVDDVAIIQGGAIASNAPLTVNGCAFYDNRAVNSFGLPDRGGAIWADATSLQVTNNDFYKNQAAGGGAILNAGFGEGGAVAWQSDPFDIIGIPVTIVMTGNTFDYNSAIGGNASQGVGGDAEGGAVFVDASGTLDMSVKVANNIFYGNTATGGDGSFGGNALGGSLQIGSEKTLVPNFGVTLTSNKFFSSGAYGGASTAGQSTDSSDTVAYAGDASGGAVAFEAGASPTPYFNFEQNTVSGALAQAGSAAAITNGAGADASGGAASGGGVYVDAGGSSNALIEFSLNTISVGVAIGGAGGDDGTNGLRGGDGSGGGIAATAGGASIFDIYYSQITSCTAYGGSGGPGLEGVANSGHGGDAGNAYGGGVLLKSGLSATYNLADDSLVDDEAGGGPGGQGGALGSGRQAIGLSGVQGGNAYGGGLAIQATEANIRVSSCKLQFDDAFGGKGGRGSYGELFGGTGGNGGTAYGGGVSVNGIAPEHTNNDMGSGDVTFVTVSILDCAAQGGDGGAAGVAPAAYSVFRGDQVE